MSSAMTRGTWLCWPSGPAAGAKVVTTAVVELFGTEFGFAK